MEKQSILLNKDFTSQQTNSDEKPIMDLKKGDVVELKEDGIYFTRKIDLGYFDEHRQMNFEKLKQFNIEP